MDSQGGVTDRLSAWLEHPALVLALMLLLASVLLHGNADKPFYNFDDEAHFREATEIPLSSLFFNLQTKYTYMPISRFSNRLDRILFGPPLIAADPSKPEPDALTLDNQDSLNIKHDLSRSSAYFGEKNWAPPVRIESAIFHALAGFVLWAFLRRLKVGPAVALIVAAAWTVHPMACESVCWISERKNVLAALFGFSALWAQTLRGKAWRWPLVSLFYFLSTLSKPTAVGVFPIIVALEFLDPSAPAIEWRNPKYWLRIAAGFAMPFLITLFIVRMGMSAHASVLITPPGGTVFTALLTDIEIFSRYTFNMIAPFNLSFFYGVLPIRSLSDWRIPLYGPYLLAIIIFVLWAAKREMRGVAALGLLWFFGALGPNANIAAIPYWMQDRYAYISTAGLLLALALAVQGLFAWLKIERLALVPGVAFVAFLGVMAFIRGPLFADSNVLIDDAGRRQSMSGMAHYISCINHANFAFYRNDPEYLNSGGKTRDAKLAVLHGDLAMLCPDIDNFTNVYRLRVKCAQIRLYMGWYEEARIYLKDWLPPKNLQMSDPNKAYTSSDMKRFYRAQTLAYAWTIMAEARWKMAMQIDRKTVPVAARIAEAQGALAEADKSIAISIWDYQGYVLKARILLFLSILDEENKDMASANKHIDEAIHLLRQVPATSELGGEATDLLAKIAPQK